MNEHFSTGFTLPSRTATPEVGTLAWKASRTFDYIGESFSDPDCLALFDAKPVLDVPSFARDYLVRNMGAANYYTSLKGDPALLAVLSALAAKQGGSFRQAEEIVVTPGAVGGFQALCSALCEPGSVMLALSPTYILFSHSVRAFGSELRLVPAEQREKFMVQPATLRRVIEECGREGKRISSLLIINPTNIDGQCYEQAEVDALCEVLKDYDFPIIEDRVYDGLDFDPPENQAYFVSHPAITHRCITLDSVSKRFGATQWRVGWVFAPKEITDAARSHVMQAIWSPAQAIQKAAGLLCAASLEEKVLEGGDVPLPSQSRTEASEYREVCRAYQEKVRATYRLRRDLALFLINGRDGYKFLGETRSLTPRATLLKEFEKEFGRYPNLLDQGIAHLSTPIIPGAAMFILVEVSKEVFSALPDCTEPDLYLAELLYKTTKVSMLPPTELTLGEDCRMFRMEYGVGTEVLFEALSRIQSFFAKESPVVSNGEVWNRRTLAA